MRSIVLATLIFVVATVVEAVEQLDRTRFGTLVAPSELRVLSSLSVPEISAEFESFVAQNPDIRIDYVRARSKELLDVIAGGHEPFDLVLSGATDVMFKLANDGHLQPRQSPMTEQLPHWAAWNDRLFVFGRDPAVLIVNKVAFIRFPVPSDRRALAALLAREPESFRGQIGVPDPRNSSDLALVTFHEAANLQDGPALRRAFGALEPRLVSSTADLIDAVERGELSLAYPVPLSALHGRPELEAVRIVVPDDGVVVPLQSAGITRASAMPEVAGDLLDHLLEHAHLRGERQWLTPGPLAKADPGALRQITLGAGLLAWQDKKTAEHHFGLWLADMKP